jgi:hypothetical protein
MTSSIDLFELFITTSKPVMASHGISGNVTFCAIPQCRTCAGKEACGEYSSRPKLTTSEYQYILSEHAEHFI